MNKRIKLWNIEFVVLSLLHLWELLWWWLNVIGDAFIYEKVHEFDSEFILDLALVLDSFFYNVTNFINCRIFSTAGDENPVIKLLIKFL